MDKEQRTLVITGGSSGIGKATASLFCERGWRVFELSRHGAKESKVESRKTATLKATGEIMHITCDVCSEESCRTAIDEVLRQTDRIDVVISNAGYGISGPIEFTEIADAEHQMDVNFMGAVRFTQAVLPQLRRQRYGRIIYTSSVAGVLAVPYQAFYSASKAAINAMALALANEVREFGISVSVLMPGDVSTGFTDARRKSIVTPSRRSPPWRKTSAEAWSHGRWQPSSTTSLPAANPGRNTSAVSCTALSVSSITSFLPVSSTG